jgi:hypothetical protein
MRKQDWLRVLHVSHASHGHAEMRTGLINQRLRNVGDRVLRLLGGVADEETEIGKKASCG